VRKILDRFPTLQSVCIAGFGEPLLVKHLGDVIQLCTNRGLYVGLITNGALLLQRAEEVLGWKLGYLSVSLNAATQAEHEAVFRTKTWQKTLEGIEYLSMSDLRIGCSFVVNRHNVRKLPQMIAVAAGAGAKFIHFHNVLPHAGPTSLAFLGGVLRVGDQDVIAAIEEAKRAPGAHIVEGWPVLLPHVSPSRCQSPFMSIGVDAAGNVSGCRRVYEPQPAFGSIEDPDVWNNAHFTRYREELSGKRDMNPTCAACFGGVVVSIRVNA
jgi:MoaA/NifB/PqqE/SkfB family radical SAM enzyme